MGDGARSFDLSGDFPRSVEGVQGFQSVLLQLHALPELWQQVQSARTYEELIRSYLDAIDGRMPHVDFAELKEVASEEWPIMRAALESKSPYSRIIRCREVTAFCPNCFIELPSGEVRIEMKPKLAPRHVAQVKELTRDGFYDGLAWFRVIGGFMAQTGYPKGKNKSGPGGKSDLPDLPAEFGAKFKRGTVGMGHGEDVNSPNSQFFVCFTDDGCADLTGKYTAWGQVIS